MLAYALIMNAVLSVLLLGSAEPVAVAQTALGNGLVAIAGTGHGARVVAESSDSSDDKPRITTIRRAGRGAGPGALEADKNAEARQEAERAFAAAGGGFPKYWIGVRLSEVPAPLAAHVGTRGAMILNVMKGSPADAVGIEQYDIVTAVDGKPVEGPSDLTDALRDRKAGDEVTLNIVRKAADRPIRVTLAERPTDQEPEPKFEETESEMEISLGGGPFQFRGRALRIGPDGKWGIHDLGQLDDLDDMLEELKIHVFDANDGAWPNLEGLFPCLPDDEKHDVSINIVVNRDGNTTEIKTDPDGKITVTRTNADGSKSSTTYENLEALEAGDPAAAELYNEHVRSHGPRVFMWHGKDGPMGREFRVEVRRKVEEALREAQEHMADAQKQAREAMEKLQQKMAKIRIDTHAEDGTTTTSESFVVNQTADGRVSVRIIKDGKITEELEYDSVDSMQKDRPQLYERLKDFVK